MALQRMINGEPLTLQQITLYCILHHLLHAVDVRGQTGVCKSVRHFIRVDALERRVAQNMAGCGGRAELMTLLDKLDIQTTTVEHPEVFTVEAMMPHLKDISGAVGKNLFMKDKKKKGLWLLTARHDRKVDLAKLAKTVGAPGGLRLADESVLLEKLGVAQGCVTPYALFNDKGGDVTFLLDSDFTAGGHAAVFFHPMVNSATTGMAPEDFMKFVRETGHEPIMVNFEEMA